MIFIFILWDGRIEFVQKGWSVSDVGTRSGNFILSVGIHHAINTIKGLSLILRIVYWPSNH
jgi:hypothetical protein